MSPCEAVAKADPWYSRTVTSAVSLAWFLPSCERRLRYLRIGLAALLVFTATKMLASEWVHVSAGVSVAVIAVVLLATIAASVWQKSTPVPAE
jgi:predicted tellurium resistance membrane protein TerC